MEKYREGFRRLSVSLGIVGVIAWVILFISIDGLKDLDEITIWAWLFLVVLTVLAYFIPYFVIKGIYWVFSGFSTKNQ